MSLKTRVERLEEKTAPAEKHRGPVIYQAGETCHDAARRCGYTDEEIAKGGLIYLPDNGRSDQ